MVVRPFRDLLLPYGKVPSDVLVAFGRNDRSILMYGMRVEGIASDELAGVVIEAQKGNLPPHCIAQLPRPSANGLSRSSGIATGPTPSAPSSTRPTRSCS